MPPTHGAIVIALGGSPHGEPPPGGPDKPLGTLPLPKDFDPGDAQPGDEMEVTVKGRLGPDGKTLDVLSVDGHADAPDDDDGDEEGPPPPNEDETPGDRWDKIRKPGM